MAPRHLRRDPFFFRYTCLSCTATAALEAFAVRPPEAFLLTNEFSMPTVPPLDLQSTNIDSHEKKNPTTSAEHYAKAYHFVLLCTMPKPTTSCCCALCPSLPLRAAVHYAQAYHFVLLRTMPKPTTSCFVISMPVPSGRTWQNRVVCAHTSV